MAKKHSKNMVVIVDSTDVSTYCQESEFGRKRSTHDVTGYGANSISRSAGLRDGTYKIGGTYDSTAVTGPRAKLEPLIDSDDPVTVQRRPEGTGSGLPQDSFSAFVTDYSETAPYNDMIKWSADFDISGDVTTTAQA